MTLSGAGTILLNVDLKTHNIFSRHNPPIAGGVSSKMFCTGMVYFEVEIFTFHIPRLSIEKKVSISFTVHRKW